jgi:curli production assembly/transport component CsgE
MNCGTERQSETTSKIVWGSARIIAGVLILFLSLGFTELCNAQKSKGSEIYRVEPGDFLVKIAMEYGDSDFWEPIYKANQDKIDDPDLIYVGQRLVIPDSIRNPSEFAGKRSQSVAHKKTDSTDALEVFRKAFRDAINEQKKENKRRPQQANDNGLEIDGLVINETRSKMGDQFFNIFYQNWEAPQDSPNFMLKITERPLPSMGTMVTVHIDNKPVFRSKLQPRNNIIEKKAMQAVGISYQTLVQRIKTANQLTIY